MALVQKGLFFIKTQGPWKTAHLGVSWLGKKLRRLPTRLRERLFHRRYAARLAQRVAGKELYVLTYAFDWNIPLFQRPHQLAKALARREGVHVVFVSDQYRFDDFPGLLSVEARLDAVSLPFLLRYPHALRGARHTTVFKSLPLQMELLDAIAYDTLVYDYIDDLSVIPCRTPELERLHRQLMARADLTVCTAQALYDDALPYAKRAMLAPNACDYALFHQTSSLTPEPALARRVEGYECVLGYYGCLEAWRLDYQLILRVARERPTWCFVLIGQCFDGSDQCLRSAGLDNIVLWPAQPHQMLPHCIASFHIQLIPLELNQITQATSPIKLFEYMAAGKPILASAMPECLRYRCVAVYHTAEEFIETAEKLRELPPDSEYFQHMAREAKENTWEKRVDEILKQVGVELDNG